jgi:hypothetical protein
MSEAGTFRHPESCVRDVLLGRLLAVTETLDLLEGRGPREPTEEDIRRAAWVFSDVLFRIEPDAIGSLYGIPAFLAGSERGIELLEERLTDPDGDGVPEAWSAVLDRLGARGSREGVIATRLSRLDEVLKLAVQPPSAEFRRRYDRHRRADEAALAAAGRSEAGRVTDLAEARRGGQSGSATIELEPIASAPLAADAPDELTRAVVSRLRRVDFVVYDECWEAGVVLGLDVGFTAGDHRAPAMECAPVAGRALLELDGVWCDESGSKDPEARSTGMTDTFADGLRDAHRAALGVLERVGVRPEALDGLANMHVRVVGLHPPVRVRDRSAGLPLALHILSAYAGLPRPRAVATGCLDARGGLGSIDDTAIAAKTRAVRDEGVRDGCIVGATGDLDDSGWPPDARRLGAKDLGEAAAEIWGDGWETFSHSVALRRLDDRPDVSVGPEGFDVAPVTLEDGTELVVPTEQETHLLEEFQRGHPKVAILGGPPQSGKSWVGRALARRLTADGWEVICMRPAGGELPAGERLVEQLGPVVASGPAGKRTLLILDGLVSTEESNRLEELVVVRDELAVSVLALARYESSAAADWSGDEVLTIASVAGRGAVTEFAEEAVSRHPEALAAARPAVGVAVKAAQGDIWLLLETLRMMARDSESSDAGTGTGIRAAFLRSRVQGLSEPAREQLAELAAASYVGVPTPPEVVELLSEDVLRRLGARRTRDGWLLRSKFVARALVLREDAGGHGAPGGTSGLDREVSVLLQRHLVRATRSPGKRADRDVVALFEGAARQSDELFGRLLRGGHRQVAGWAGGADARALARVLRRTGYRLDRAEAGDLAQQLADALLSQLPGPYNARDLALCVRTLVRYRHHLDAPREDAPPLADELLEQISQTLPQVLAARALPLDRIYLLRQLHRLQSDDDDIPLIVRENLEAFFGGLRPTRAADYRAAAEGIELARRIARREPPADDPDPAEPAEQNEEKGSVRVYTAGPDGVSASGGARDNLGITALAPIRALLDAEERPGDDASLRLARLALRLVADEEARDNRTIIDETAQGLRTSARRTPMRELSASLATLASHNRGLGAGLLSRADLGTALATKMATGGAGEAAVMLGTLARVHNRTARDMLYDGAEPRMVPLTRIAEKARLLGDAKGAGMLLKEAADIDDLYGSVLNGFAHRFAERLGPAFTQHVLEVDPRPSVIYHLVRGLVASGASYLEVVRDHALHQISASISHHARAWAPKLALLLGGEDALGEDFLVDLAGVLDTTTLGRRLILIDDTEALAEFHRLAAVTHPELAGSFATRYERQWVRRLAAAARRPELTARALAAVSATLLRAGVEDPGATLVRDFEREGDPFSARLLRARYPGDAAETLRILRKLDPEAARRTVEPVHDGELAERVRRALPDPAIAMELLDAIEDAAPGCGEAILDRLRGGRSWRPFVENVAHIQDPRKQAEVYIRLARLGYIPSDHHVRHVTRNMSELFGDLRSPQVVGAVIRMLAAWDAGLGYVRRIAGRLPRAGLEGRLAAGARPDIRAAAPLVGTLVAVGEEEAAAEVARGLGHVDRLGERLDPSELQALIRAVAPVQPDLAGPLCDAALVRLDRAARHGIVLDTAQHWRGIGWLAQRLSARDRAAPAPSEEPATLPAADPVTTAWGLVWLEGNEWSDARLHAALDTLASGVPRGPWAAAATLCAASVAGRVDDVLEHATVARALRASPLAVGVLLERARADARLRDALLGCEPELAGLRRRLASPAERAKYEAWNALRTLGELEGSRATGLGAAER